MSKTLFLIDAFSIAYRSFYAYPLHLTDDEGKPINAVYGFVSLIFKAIDMIKPDYVCVCFDTKEPTFRHELFGDYKGHRPAPPEEFVVQIPYFRQVLDDLAIPWIDSPGYEADDLFGTMSVEGTKHNLRTVIMTGDHDALQLVNDSVTVIMNKKGVSDFVYYTPEAVEERYSFGPDTIVDFKALKGDSSDNIPGVKGIGDKTATKLLSDFSNLDGIYKNLDHISSKSVRSKLENDKELAYVSKLLATIKCDVPIDYDWQQFIYSPDWTVIKSVFLRYKFNSLLSKYQSQFDSSEIPQSSQAELQDEQTDLVEGQDATNSLETIDLPVQGMYQLIETVEQLNLLLPIMKHGFAIDLETTGLSPHSAQIVGIALAMSERKAYYIPLNDYLTDTLESTLPMFDSVDAEPLLAMNPFLEFLKPLLEDESIPKYTHNGKYEYQLFRRYDITCRGLTFDTLIAAYLLYPGQRLGLKELVNEHFGFEMQTFESLVSKSAPYQRFEDVPVNKALAYAAADADFTYRLMRLFKPQIDKNFESIFYQLEMPLMTVLAEMEYEGVTVDVPFLHGLHVSFQHEIETIESTIFQQAGQKFNLNSPKQLADLLFNQMGIPVVKKNKSGPSTDSSVLEKLSVDYPFVADILKYRHFTKLINTYVKALPDLVHPVTKKLHAQFNQTIAATGRLSSSNPNLQNIPIRTPEGIQIRKAFVPSEKGGFILSADYSQVELRVLAHLAEDPNMIKAFSEGLDIHQSTAALVFGVPYDQVTKEQRYQAKTVNFGITYGQSAFALADQLGISRVEAKTIIDTYYDNFPNIRRFIDETIKFAFQYGYVETAFGRRRYIPDLQSSNRTVQNGAQRVAVNTRVQGTAADIIKYAMIEVPTKLNEAALNSKMIIQVHDELVFDGAKGEEDALSALVQELMESIVAFSVPLKVDVAIASNWMDCEG